MKKGFFFLLFLYHVFSVPGFLSLWITFRIISTQQTHYICWHKTPILYTNIDKTLMKSLHGLLNCEIGGLDCRVVTTEYRTRVHFYKHVTPILQCIGPCDLFRSFRSIFVYNRRCHIFNGLLITCVRYICVAIEHVLLYLITCSVTCSCAAVFNNM